MVGVSKDRPASVLRRVLEAAEAGDDLRVADPAVTILPYIPKGRRPGAVAARPSLTLQAGFIPPCLPMMAPRPPEGGLWLHEIKHDGVRIIARNDGRRVRLYGGTGDDLTARYPLIVETMARLPACTIDGEAIACDARGIASRNLLRQGRRDATVILYAFDLIEVEGEDRRRDALAHRKLDLSRLLVNSGPGILANEWVEGGDSDGAAVFAQACALGLEGVVWKRKDSRYLSGRSPYWLMMKNQAQAVPPRAADPDRDSVRQ